jgi:ubiquinone/menaquinone biosynthesis C-methylase UbiE
MRMLLRYEDSKLMRDLSLSGKRVLELGCGSLPILLAIPEGTFTYVGTDLSENGVRLAKGLVPRGHFVVCDATAPPLSPRQFDIIVMKNLLHHIERPEACLQAVQRLLAPGGIVVAMEPNSTCILANVAKVLLNLVGRKLEESPYGQLKLRRLREAFFATDFEVVEERHSGLLAFPLSGDHGSLRLMPMSVSLWRAIIALDRRLSGLLVATNSRVAPWLSFKVTFYLKAKQGAERLSPAPAH